MLDGKCGLVVPSSTKDKKTDNKITKLNIISTGDIKKKKKVFYFLRGVGIFYFLRGVGIFSVIPQ